MEGSREVQEVENDVQSALTSCKYSNIELLNLQVIRNVFSRGLNHESLRYARAKSVHCISSR
jgi:hypothetical protein